MKNFKISFGAFAVFFLSLAGLVNFFFPAYKPFDAICVALVAIAALRTLLH